MPRGERINHGRADLYPLSRARRPGRRDGQRSVRSVSLLLAEMFESPIGFSDLDLAAICFNGPEDRLNQTDISQPAIYAASIASFRAARGCGRDRSGRRSRHMPGLSLGEYTALHLAGVFGFEEGLKLVAARGRYMQEAAVASPSGMVAILGADEDAVTSLCRASGRRRGAGAGESQRTGTDRRQRIERRVRARAESRRGGGIQGDGAEGRRRISQPADAARGRPNARRTGTCAICFCRRRSGLFQRHGPAAWRSRRRSNKLLVDQIVSPVQWERTMKTLLTRRGRRDLSSWPRPIARGAGQADQSPASDRECGDGRVLWRHRSCKT